MSKTIEVTSALAPANEAMPVEVKHEAIDYATANTALRREMAKVVFGKIIDNLSDDDLDKYTGVAEDINAKYSAHLKHEVAEHEPVDAEMPKDAADAAYDYDTVDAEAQVAGEVAPLREGAAERLGFTWTKGAGLFINGVLFAASRSERMQQRMAVMSEAERDQYIKKRARIAKVATYTVAAAATVWTFKSAGNYFSLFGGASTGANHMAPGTFHAGDNKGADHNYTLADSEKPDLTDFDKAILNHYNNSDASFYDFAHKQFRGDFGPSLRPLSTDGTMPAGFNDWMLRNQHEPHGLANLVSGLKLDGHGDSMADRNALGNVYEHDKIAQVKADIMVQNELRDPNKYSLKTIDLKSYNSTYMVDANGNPVISMKNNLHLGGHAIAITNKTTGETTYWRTECGGYQQVWPVEEAPVRPAPATPQPANYIQAPEKPVTTTTPPTNTPPVNIPPVTIPPIDIPPTTTPPTPPPPVTNEAKIPALDINARNLSENKKMGDVRMGSGALQSADQVKPEPDVYKPPKPDTTNTDTAAGAKPSQPGGLHDRGSQGPQQSGTSTGAASGSNNGNTKGKVSQ